MWQMICSIIWGMMSYELACENEKLLMQRLTSLYIPWVMNFSKCKENGICSTDSFHTKILQYIIVWWIKKQQYPFKVVKNLGFFKTEWKIGHKEYYKF